MARGDRKKRIGGHIVTLTNLPNQQIKIGIKGDDYNAQRNFTSRTHGLNAFRRMENMGQVRNMAGQWASPAESLIEGKWEFDPSGSILLLTKKDMDLLKKNFKLKREGPNNFLFLNSTIEVDGGKSYLITSSKEDKAKISKVLGIK